MRLLQPRHVAVAMASSSMASSSSNNNNKKPRLSSSTTNTKQHVYKIWPSSLVRAGHTTVTVEDPKEPLFDYLDKVQPNERYGIRMGRMEHLPCLLQESSKYRHGAERWWCPVHQGGYGTKKHLEEFAKTGVRRCEHADDPVDFVRVDDIPVLTLTKQPDMKDNTTYCELGIWIGLPPSINTRTPGTHFFPGIHVHARKEPGGKKLLDTNFPAVTIRDETGRFPQLQGEGVTITSPAALEYLYYMENQCPVNKQLLNLKDSVEKNKEGPVPRPVDTKLVQEVRCKHCGSLHEDIGDFFGKEHHKKHLCGQCGRDIWNTNEQGLNIGNPLLAFEREFQREIVGRNENDAHLARLDLDQDKYHIMMWPSTPAIFWSRGTPEVWGAHLHGYDKKTGECVIDDTYGEVWMDGKQLDRSDLFKGMVKATKWVSDKDATPEGAEELEDD